MTFPQKREKWLEAVPGKTLVIISLFTLEIFNIRIPVLHTLGFAVCSQLLQTQKMLIKEADQKYIDKQNLIRES